MNKYSFGKASLRRLGTMHSRLQHLLWRAMETWDGDFDWGVVCGFRGEDDQVTAYANGDSMARWGESAHNFMIGNSPCSLAFDIAPYDPTIRNYMWHDRKKFQVLFAHVLAVAQELGMVVKWGASFRSMQNGDLPHGEVEI